MKVKVKHKGNFKNLEKFLKRSSTSDLEYLLEKYGEIGVQKLREATPKDTGLTADSWYYKVTVDKGKSKVEWFNSNVGSSGYTFGTEGVYIALLLQYGHGTNNGGYVEGIDYINPALKSVFDDLAVEAWKEVTGHE